MVDAACKATAEEVSAAKRLVQRSTDAFSIIVPSNVETIWSGTGSGAWIPALVFVPNEQIEK